MFEIYKKSSPALALWASLMMASCSQEPSESKIKDYIASHPEEIASSLKLYQEEYDRRSAQKQSKSVSIKVSQFSKNAAVVFNQNGDIEITEIIDLNCAFCRKSFSKIKEKIANDWKDVRLNIIALPIISNDSELAIVALRSQATHSDRSQKMLDKLISSEGLVDNAFANKLVKEAAINVEKLPSIYSELRRDTTIAKDIPIRATPSFIVNGKIIEGFKADEILSSINESRTQHRR